MENPLTGFSWASLHLLRPYVLLLLLPFILLIIRLVKSKGSSQAWQKVCDPALLDYLLIGQTQPPRRWPLAFLAMSGLIAITALAGPVWKELPQPVFREQSALIVLLDLSRSMHAADLRPDRLTRAKQKLSDLLQQRKEGQTALIVFAGSAFVVTPLTSDTQTISGQLQGLNSDIMPRQGSRIDLAINKAIELLKRASIRHGDLLLIGDSARAGHPDKLADALATLTAAGHRLSVMAVGTADGAPINLTQGGFLKDRQGQIVISRLDETSMSQLADQGRGIYTPLTLGDNDLSRLAQRIKPEKWRSSADATTEKPSEGNRLNHDQWQEEGPWLLLLLLPFAALAFRRGWLLVIFTLPLLFMPEQSDASAWEKLWLNRDQQAQHMLQQDRYSEAAEHFDNPAWQAAAHYKAGQYEQALEALKGAERADDIYNRGNALARLGRIEEAIAAYDAALKRNPEHHDAAYNRQQLKQLQKQKEQKEQAQKEKQGQGEQQADSQQQQDGKNGQQQGSDNAEDRQQQNSASSTTGDGQKQASEAMSNSSRKEGSKEDRATSSSAMKDGEKPPAEAQNSIQDNAQKKQQETSEEQQAETQTTAQTETATEKKQTQNSDKTTEELNRMESNQAYEQWLRRVPDDPGGLLRRKFLYQYQQKKNARQSDEEQAW